MFDYAITESQFAKYSNEFQLIERVDKSTGAIIGAVWREILNNSEDKDLAFKVKGFVQRGTEIYALVQDTQFYEYFEFYNWLKERLTFNPDVPLNPLYYIQIFGIGHLPEKLPYLLSDIDRNPVKKSVYVDTLKQPIQQTVTPMEEYPTYDDSEEATTLLIDSYYVLKNRDYQFNLYEEQGEQIIGRGRAADLSFREKYVSRNHARIRLDHDGLKIYDLGSSNGTKINGRKVRSHEWTYVRVGDILTIGRANLDVSFVEED